MRKIAIVRPGTWVRSASEVIAPRVLPKCYWRVPRVLQAYSQSAPGEFQECSQSAINSVTISASTVLKGSIAYILVHFQARKETEWRRQYKRGKRGIHGTHEKRREGADEKWRNGGGERAGKVSFLRQYQGQAKETVHRLHCGLSFRYDCSAQLPSACQL